MANVLGQTDTWPHRRRDAATLLKYTQKRGSGLLRGEASFPGARMSICPNDSLSHWFYRGRSPLSNQINGLQGPQMLRFQGHFSLKGPIDKGKGLLLLFGQFGPDGKVI